MDINTRQCIYLSPMPFFQRGVPEVHHCKVNEDNDDDNDDDDDTDDDNEDDDDNEGDDDFR